MRIARIVHEDAHSAIFRGVGGVMGGEQHHRCSWRVLVVFLVLPRGRWHQLGIVERKASNQGRE
jgi:hypothetical protein